MKRVLPFALATLMAGCSRPSGSHSRAALDIDWARRDQERRLRAHEDTLVAAFRSTLASDKSATAEVVSAIPEWLRQLRRAEPAFRPESILWSPGVARLSPSSFPLSESLVRNVREGEVGAFYGHDGEPAPKGSFRAVLSQDSAWAVDLHEGAGSPEPIVTVFDLRGGRRLEIDKYSERTSFAALGWANSRRLVVASWGETLSRGRRVPEVRVYDLDTMTSRHGMSSPITFQETR